MTKPRIDLTGTYTHYYATALLKEGESFGGEREYLIRLPPKDSTDTRVLGTPVVQCHSEMQLAFLHQGFNLDPNQDEDEQVQIALWHLSGRLMSRRVFNEDFYESGRECMGYEFVWLPGSAFEKIHAALEGVGEHGLAALLREGRVETK